MLASRLSRRIKEYLLNNALWWSGTKWAAIHSEKFFGIILVEAGLSGSHSTFFSISYLLDYWRDKDKQLSSCWLLVRFHSPGTEKKELSYTVGENVNGYTTMENSMEVPWKNKNKTTIWPSIRRDKKALLSDQCKDIEENNRKTRDLFKNITDTKGTFHAKMGTIKGRNRWT